MQLLADRPTHAAAAPTAGPHTAQTFCASQHTNQSFHGVAEKCRRSASVVESVKMSPPSTSDWAGLAPGLQELLSEGNFVDVRICCSDHSPSDGLGAHRAMLAAASQLLRKTLPQDLTDDEMTCIHLPNYSSTSVASVLSGTS